MVIVGAKGFAKEVLEVLHQNGDMKSVSFFDDISEDIPSLLFNSFQVLRSEVEILNFIKDTGDKRFTLGVGDPFIRFMLYKKFVKWGGIFSSTISPYARVGNYDVQIAEGVNLMTGTVITNSIEIGKGVLINLNCTIGHDTSIGEFTEMSPGVHISGGCRIGSFVNMGTNSTVLPKIAVGSNVIIGAGAVVTKDIPANSLAVGIPAKVIRTLDALKFD